MPKPQTIMLRAYIRPDHVEFLEMECARRGQPQTARRGRNSLYSQIVREALELYAEYTAHSEFVKAKAGAGKVRGKSAAGTGTGQSKSKPVSVGAMAQQIAEARAEQPELKVPSVPTVPSDMRIDGPRDVLIGGMSPAYVLGRAARRRARERYEERQAKKQKSTEE